MEPSFDKHWQEMLEEESLGVLWDSLDPRIKEHVIELSLRRATHLLTEVELCESPIEQMLGIWISYLVEVTGFGDEGCCVLSSQQEIQTPLGLFRVDFVVAAKTGGKHVSLVVECDGHDFHEKTKEQARRDKKRDRALMLAGYGVVHFTGSEIWADPRKCAMEVLQQLRALAKRD